MTGDQLERAGQAGSMGRTVPVLSPRAEGACRRFEAAWQAGLRPRVEDYLADCPEPEQSSILRELLAREVTHRRRLGEWPTAQEYRARLPDFAALIDAAFEVTAPAPSDSSAEQPSTELAPTDDAVDRAAATEPPVLLADTELIPGNGMPKLPPGLTRPPEPVAGADLAASAPRKIGRYTLERVLGEGTFGRVYLASDGELHRSVAIKVPRAEAFRSAENAEDFLREARMAAALNHPAIVKVFDIGRHRDCGIFVVMECIDGLTLSGVLASKSLSRTHVVELLVSVAEALQHAHIRGLVHRDLKPSNILVDREGRPHVCDFGLAVHEDGQRLRSGEVAGSPAYMAPEQVRGETHRLDGRTDIWSLGVMLYQVFTGRMPFSGSRRELFDEILNREPKPPRQIDVSIPREVERICLKCLAKRMNDRYTTAADLAEDLSHWLARQPAPVPVAVEDPDRPSVFISSAERVPAKVVPRGLRSFDSQDVDFFLELLPGPRDREGLPDRLRFWKTRIEETEPDKTFSVGLIYGPSGCGKSSLVKAGILPRLDGHVLPIYVEATPAETETRLLASLRRRLPSLPGTLGLTDTVAALRERASLLAGRKVLIILDQFEQWLHSQPEGQHDALTQALRQCDGQRVQSIIMVRDDFWMAVTRFMRDLEVRLVEGVNSAPVDLFDPAHARKVLAEFGRAFERLPENLGEMSADQERFLDQSIRGLKRADGTIIPVRLSLFGEMVRNKPWTPATLKEVGGTEGIGVAFLEETFSASTAPPEHRLHQNAARLVLKALLPEVGVNIKGQMRSYTELLEASGYAARPTEFRDLMPILDTELRLVTPTDPEGSESADPGSSRTRKGEKYYQLTHDDLVPSLRQWLTRKQRETLRGRAEICLAERVELWSHRPEKRNLPSWWEWSKILVCSRRRDWTAPERKMMRSATRHHTIRTLSAAAVLGAAALGLLKIRSQLDERNRANQASGLVARLLVADITQVPAIIKAIDSYRDRTDSELARIARDSNQSPKDRTRAALALLPVDGSQVEFLTDRLLTAEPEAVLVIRDQLAPKSSGLVNRLWKLAADASADPSQRLRSACALAAFDPDSPRWNGVADDLGAMLVAENPIFLKWWIDALRPAQKNLLGPLGEIFRDAERNDSERFMAMNILANYMASDPVGLAELVKDAEPRQYAELFEALAPHRAAAVAIMSDELSKQPSADDSDNARDQLATRQANAAMTLFRLGLPERVWSLLKLSPEPQLRSNLINGFAPMGADPNVLAERLSSEQDVSIRRALLLGLESYDQEKLPHGLREALEPGLIASYRTDSDPGMHSALELLLRKWGQAEQLKSIHQSLAVKGAEAVHGWYVNGQGHTMVVVDPPGRNQTPAGVAQVTRPFAMATTEVTVEQYRRFRTGHYFFPKGRPEPDLPANVILWYEAAAYCRWLSEQEQVPADQMCYPPIPEIKPGMRLPPDYLKRTGYRLPTYAEWRWASSAGAATQRYYGNSEGLLAKYAWYSANAHFEPSPVARLKPNDFGLFDTLGNELEWCQESHAHMLGIRHGRDREDGEPVTNELYRMLVGGAYLKMSEDVRVDRRETAYPQVEYNSVSFRVARTCLPKP